MGMLSYTHLYMFKGLLRSLSGKESACQWEEMQAMPAGPLHGEDPLEEAKVQVITEVQLTLVH